MNGGSVGCIWCRDIVIDIHGFCRVAHLWSLSDVFGGKGTPRQRKEQIVERSCRSALNLDSEGDLTNLPSKGYVVIAIAGDSLRYIRRTSSAPDSYCLSLEISHPIIFLITSNISILSISIFKSINMDKAKQAVQGFLHKNGQEVGPRSLHLTRSLPNHSDSF